MNEIGLNKEDWNKHFRLTGNINLGEYTGTSFNLIGDYGTPFSGVFDGNDFEISGFTYSDEVSSWKGYVGLFGVAGGENTEIKNIRLLHPSIHVTNGNILGGLVGLLSSGRVSNCHVFEGSIAGSKTIGAIAGHNEGLIIDSSSATSVLGVGTIGGLAGRNDHEGVISNCSSSGDVTGQTPGVASVSSIGGLVGFNYGTISDCQSTGIVLCDGNFAGGLVGFHSTGNIINCSATGAVSGDMAGGLIGTANEGDILSCYATGDVTGERTLGGLVGSSEAVISKCYARGNVSGQSVLGGLVGSNDGVIMLSYAESNVTGTSYSDGGLVGSNDGTIADCYANGSVLGSIYVGGLAGENEGEILNCYSAAHVEGGSIYVGGLVGRNRNSVADSYWDTEVSGLEESEGGSGQLSADMYIQNTFTGWDFTNEILNGANDIWRLCEDGSDYPHLAWEFGSDYLCPEGVFMEDLLFLSSRWLESGLDAYTSADRTGDGIVNFDDYALLAEQWMSGVEIIPGMTYMVGECDSVSESPTENPLRFTVKAEGYFIDFEDLIFANCCIEEGFRLDMMVEGTLVTLSETELSEGLCDCLCNYPTTARIGPFEPGTYTVQVDQVNYSGYVASIGRMEVVIDSDQ